MRPCIPATSAPSATGRQSRELQKGLACPKARPNRSRHRFAAPPSARRATAPERIQAPFSLDRARPVSLLARPKGAPAAPRAVGRGGARERAQFSPQAETELSGLCDDDNGGRIPRGSGPLREQNPPWPPDGGPNFHGRFVTSLTRSRGGHTIGPPRAVAPTGARNGFTPARRCAPADNPW